MRTIFRMLGRNSGTMEKKEKYNKSAGICGLEEVELETGMRDLAAMEGPRARN